IKKQNPLLRLDGERSLCNKIHSPVGANSFAKGFADDKAAPAVRPPREWIRSTVECLDYSFPLTPLDL
ncbi:MAG: hypothetical protein ACRER8_24340, partial [Pseudomonas sp.]|uniref:hypothetical protein n=1 Tax=Pseudomonas sp. TaxID=306 RepID=UPI003D6DD2F5